MSKIYGLLVGSCLLASLSAWSMDLDWSGQFRTEAHWVHGFEMGNPLLPQDARYGATTGATGYYVPGSGSDDAHFQTAFLRLRPKLVVNDNVYIKSEWWVGDPIYGMFGNAAPYTADQKQFYSSQSRGSTITAQRVWLEAIAEMGTLQVGRAPLHWGLGLFYNSGDNIWDRYQSTGDTVRMISKFGAFTFIPAITKYSLGNSLAGASVYNPTTGAYTFANGGGGMSDYTITFKFENPDEDFEGGVNFVKRIAGAAPDPNAGYLGVGGTPSGMSFNVWDLYGKKKFGKLSVGGELPITNGDISGLTYKTYALALETQYQPSDSWDFSAKAGHAPGQPSSPSAATKFRAFYFNPNYDIALIMFNYQLRNFAGPNAQNNAGVPAGRLASPWDNPIVNANYLALGGAFNTNKWSFRGNFAYAKALETAKSGQNYYNTWTRSFDSTPAVKDQGTSLGWEMDYGTTFRWDENFQFLLDFGWYFPGDFYKFSNTAIDNRTDSVFATVLRIGVDF